MRKLSRFEMKALKGGNAESPDSCCFLFCGLEKKERECGENKTCTTDKTKICCGDDCVEVCTPTL